MATQAAPMHAPDTRASVDLTPFDAVRARGQAVRRIDAFHTEGILERLRIQLQATRVSLIRFANADESFEVVASTGALQGFPLLVPGVRLPVIASAVASTASSGRIGRFSDTRNGQPIERMAVLLGLRSGMAIPLKLATTALGATVVLWNTARARTLGAQHAMREHETHLLQVLVAPDRTRPHVMVCHEDPLMARGLGQIVADQLDATTTVACTLPAALSATVQDQPGLIVLSDHLAGGRQLDDVAHSLRQAGAAAPLLVLARTDTSDALNCATHAGATGYLPLALAATSLAETAARVLDGRSALPARSEGISPPRLSDREHDVLRCLDRGLSDKQIANELGVATSTVKTHARGIYGKLGVTSRTSALHRARRTGLI